MSRKFQVNQLEQEIIDNTTITVDPDYSQYEEPDQLTVYFPSALSAPQETELNTLVTNHIPVAPPNIKKVDRDYYFLLESVGPCLTAPDGGKWRIKVDNVGAISTESAS